MFAFERNPELTKFYDEHAADRNRFEILSICNTEYEKAQSIEAFDILAAPLVKNIWAGKQLPFRSWSMAREKRRASMAFKDGRPCC